jgi:hypothetical protein
MVMASSVTPDREQHFWKQAGTNCISSVLQFFNIDALSTYFSTVKEHIKPHKHQPFNSLESIDSPNLVSLWVPLFGLKRK